jgi:hypothetical protein
MGILRICKYFASNVVRTILNLQTFEGVSCKFGLYENMDCSGLVRLLVAIPRE